MFHISIYVVGQTSMGNIIGSPDNASTPSPGSCLHTERHNLTIIRDTHTPLSVWWSPQYFCNSCNPSHYHLSHHHPSHHHPSRPTIYILPPPPPPGLRDVQEIYEVAICPIAQTHCNCEQSHESFKYLSKQVMWCSVEMF